MKNPKILTEITKGATYDIPTFKVTNEGLVDGDGAIISFCKGNKANEQDFRQEGFFTETLLQVCKQYLEAVNVGEMSTRETSLAITKIQEALFWISVRAEDRKLREVQGTYNK